MKNKYGKMPRDITIKDLRRTISKTNLEFIDRYIAYRRGSITDKRLLLIHNSLVKFADLLEMDFDKAEKDDITKAWNIIIASEELAVKTKQDEYLNIRQGFKYFFGDDEEFPKQVRGMKRPKGRAKLRLPEEMPTESIIHDAIRQCLNYRDKFFMSYLGLDAGARPIELRNLTWARLKKDEHGYYFNIKTAKESGDFEDRPIRVVFSEPYLLDWMKNYPGQLDDDCYVFCDLDDPNKKISTTAITKLFQRVRKKLGLKIKFTPYVLRHAVLTRMGKDPKVPLSVLKKFAGHTQSSSIIGEYQHYGSDDVKHIQMQHAGKAVNRQDTSYQLTKVPIKCPHCGKSNEHAAEVCGFCNMALSQKRMVHYEDYRKRTEALEKEQKKMMILIEKLTSRLTQLHRSDQLVSKTKKKRKKKN